MTKYYLAIDTETGGLDSREYKLLEIAGVLGDDKGRILETYSWLIEYPDEEFLLHSAQALMINRYLTRKNQDDVYKIGQANEVATDWATFSIGVAARYGQDLRLLGQNLQFDVDFINRFVEDYAHIKGWKELFGRHHCDTKLVAQYLKDCDILDTPIQSTSLEYLVKYFNVQLANRIEGQEPNGLERLRNIKGHCALDDAEATYRLYLKMLSLIQRKDIS